MLEALVLALLAQAPATADQGLPEVVAFVGTVELSPAAAYETALAAAEAGREERLQRAGARAVESAPFWLPRFVSDRTLTAWAAGEARFHGLEVVDREDKIRDHGFGPSYQTTLRVAGLRPSPDALRALEIDLREAGRLFLAMCAGTVAFWSVLALSFWWFDRLSRGYMTARLLALSVAVGMLLPGIVLALA